MPPLTKQHEQAAVHFFPNYPLKTILVSWDYGKRLFVTMETEGSMKYKGETNSKMNENQFSISLII